MHFTNKRGAAARLASIVLASTMVFPPSTAFMGIALADAAAQSPGNTGTTTVSTTGGFTDPIILKSVLIFPASNDSGAPADTANIASLLDAAIKVRLDSVGRYKTTFYSPHLAAIDRALSDRVLSDEDLTGPFDDPAKAGHIAQQVDTEGFLTTTVEHFDSDPVAKTSTVEVSADLYDTASGNALKVFTVTGRGTAMGNGDMSDAVNQQAINDAAGQIVRSLNVQAPVHPVVVTASQVGSAKHNSGQTALLAILGGAILYALLHHGSDGGVPAAGTGGGTNPAPPPPSSSGPPSPPVL